MVVGWLRRWETSSYTTFIQLHGTTESESRAVHFLPSTAVCQPSLKHRSACSLPQSNCGLATASTATATVSTAATATASTALAAAPPRVAVPAVCATTVVAASTDAAAAAAVP